MKTNDDKCEPHEHAVGDEALETQDSLASRLRASEAARREAQMPLMQCLRLYPKAAAFSAIISVCIIMEGYDVNLLQGLFAFDPLKRRYGM